MTGMAYGKVRDSYWDSDRINKLSDRAALLRESNDSNSRCVSRGHEQSGGISCNQVLGVDRDSDWGYSQGQRTLSSLRSKDLHQEVVAPTGDLAFSFDAVFRRMLLQ